MNPSRSCVIRLPWRVILWSIIMNSWLTCFGFQVLHSIRCCRGRHPVSKSCGLKFPDQSWMLWNHADSKDSTSSESDGSIMDDTSLSRISSRRVGGRFNSSLRNKGRDDEGRNIFIILSGSWKQWTLPILIAGFLVSSLFGRIGSQTQQQSYVFYQSNVYETRMVGSDGKIQTSRQETIRTNLPQALRATQSESRESKIVVTEDDFDIRELEQDMKSMWENLLY